MSANLALYEAEAIVRQWFGAALGHGGRRMIGGGIEDRYKLIRQLGAGATGEVWLAEHIHLGRQEAVKVLRLNLASDRELVARFRREARAANRLRHQSIITIYDFGQLTDGRFYLAMEFVPGDDLRTHLQRHGRLAPARAMRILAQLADAIDHAHELGVIHRDLKPENMILAPNRAHTELIKVLDFGLAKVIAPDAHDTTTTRRGSVFGTLEYVAPEQLKGENSDPRMDIYSFGCIAFELLTGEPPFSGRPMEILDAHMNRPARRVTEVRPEASIPTQLEAIVLRCLEKDPRRRFQRARDIVPALEAVPGFAPERSESGRRNYQPFGSEESTEERSFVSLQQALGGMLAAAQDEAQPVDADPIRWEYETLLGVLAAALLDAGSNDIQLVLAHTDFGAIWQSIAALNDELTELGRRSEKVEQQARDQESRLRFMLGDLRFERENLGGHAADAGELSQRIATLENQLVNVLKRRDREIASLLDREVLLVAELADREDALANARRKLAAAVAAQIPSFAGTEPIATLHKRVLERRELLGLDA